MKLLSYPLGPETPTFLENPPVRVRQVSSIAEGGVANWFEVTTINHNGTHVDAPFHYWQDGPRLADLALEEFVFTSPLLIDLPKNDGELITAVDLAPYAGDFARADLLLVRSGFAALCRESDPQRYGRRAPGFHPSAAEVLLAPGSKLRAIVMDFPSANSPLHLDEGNQFHREVLGATGRGRYLLLVEDARLEATLVQADLGRVLVVPIFYNNLDAAQCTILAEP